MKQHDPQVFSIPCAKFAEKLTVVYPNDLSSAEQAQLEEHLSTCSACSSVFAEYRRMDMLTKNLPPVDPPAHLPPELEALLTQQHDPIEPEHVMSSDMKLPRVNVHPGSLQSYQVGSRPAIKRARLLQSVNLLVAACVVVILAASGLVLFTRHDSGASRVKGTPQTLIYTTAQVQGNKKALYAFDPIRLTLVWQKVFNGQVYILNERASQGHLFVKEGDAISVFDASTGTLSRQFSLHYGLSDFRSLTTDYPRSLYVDDTAIYFTIVTGEMYALSAQNGELLWHTSVNHLSSCDNPLAREGSFCQYTIASVANGVVYAYFGGLSALRADNGQLLWHNDRMSRAGIHALAISGETLYTVSAQDWLLYALNTSDGKIRRMFSELSAQALNANRIPGIMPANLFHVQDTIFLAVQASSDAHALIIALRGSDGRVLWRQNFPTQNPTLLAVDTNNLYLQSRSLAHPGTATYIALDIHDGSFSWRVPKFPKSDLGSSIVVLGGKIYSFSKFGKDEVVLGKEELFLHVIGKGKYDIYPIVDLLHKRKE